MLNHLKKFWDDLRGSYWFIPSLMSLAAFLVSHLLVANDSYLQQTFFKSLDWIYLTQPEGARTVLSTIAGSMITVAGVTFSITIASVAYATSQYGPRLLTNFMEDRGNQFTLGTFIATFLYCLLVLRTINSAQELAAAQAGSEAVQAFVPNIAVSFGVLMATASICVFIYFIHHVPASIHASNVIADIGNALIKSIQTSYPESPFVDTNKDNLAVNLSGADFSQPENQNAIAFLSSQEETTKHTRISSKINGYVQFLDHENLYQIAQELDATIIVNCQPGDYVSTGGCLGWVVSKDKTTKAPDNDLCAAFIIGRKRTPAQDLLFLSTELIEIAARALSPGTNDPFTAINCMNWLSSACICLADRHIEKPQRYDNQNNLRLLYRHVDFIEFTNTNFARLSPYVATDRNAALHFVAIVGCIALSCPQPSQKRAILSLLPTMIEDASKHLSESMVKELYRRNQVITGIVSKPETADQLLLQERWLTGNAS